ncbi:phosphotransferase family protein [Pseudonocardia kunmingensis]|uniref:Aminoglycoside phosphotransferase (APT) family kinase protein n=1 Tax=Pseudonocardia kunmingensis TaxID=630975 RepID=A0A543DRJ1_9PSEU|nr:phosphotransferase family protein [Pseudonocardia kunmingensis]TQM11950.1 aminoglycoside phosphotransferase (APT) family kinase protein [Pseudonocardia kunmingensis]
MTTAVLDGRAVDAADPDVLARLLERRLAAVLGTGVTVPPPTRLTGGASRETWSFAAHVAGGPPRRLVLRRDPPGAGRPEGMAREADAIAAAQAGGVPVPRLVDSGTDPAVLGSPYLLTEHVDGETIARRLLREPRYAAAREGLAAELGRTLARIHAIPVEDVPGLEPVEPLESLRATYDALGEPLPTIEIAMKWLERHRPADVAETVVHGDFRTGNLIVDPDGLRAVLDWEVVHRGDPREDLGWLCVKCWRFGSPLPAGGFGTVEQLLDGYAEVAGHRPDPEAVRWWQVYGTARWAVGCRGMAERHLSGQTPSVELAAIGRRVCEQEHDVLLALGLPAEPLEAGDPAPGSDLHGHPTAAELVAAVSMFLREDVMPATEGRLNFLARVAAGALDGVGRELLLGPEQERRHRERLAAFAQDDQAGLAAAIRAGVLEADDPALLAAVRAAVTDRLAVANPRYLAHPG